MAETKEKDWLGNEGKQVMSMAFDTFGAEHQKIVAIEEFSELIKEICKDLRGIGDREHIVEEIADSEIMLSQLKEKAYGICESEIRDVKESKLRRLMNRVRDWILRG